MGWRPIVHLLFKWLWTQIQLLYENNPGHRQTIKKSWQKYSNRIYSSYKGGIFITKNDTKLLSLAPQLGRLSIPIFEELCEIEYQIPSWHQNIFAIALLISFEDMNQILK